VDYAFVALLLVAVAVYILRRRRAADRAPDAFV
jgi:hypothetical protein